MAKTACVAAVAAPGDLDAIAVGYIDAADGDPRVALRWALEDLLAVERQLVQAYQAVSQGYVRARPAEG